MITNANTSSEPTPEAATSDAQPRPQRAKRGRILVVDDELNARTALADVLREEGYEVETAADGFKAAPKLQEFTPELLLTDLKMPGMDGLHLMTKAFDMDMPPAAILMTASGTVG